MTTAGVDGTATDQPVLRLVRGNPTPEELAALTAVLLGRTTGPEPDPAAADTRRTRARWRRPERPQRYACPRAWPSGAGGALALR